MPAEVLAFRHTCGRFTSIFISFMTDRAKLAADYTRRVRNAHTQCVLLAVVILQLLLCAGDVEQNPGPDNETESLLQTMLSQQYDKLLTQFEKKLNERFQTFSDGLLNKLDSVCCALQDQVQMLITRTTKLEENFSGILKELKKTQSATNDTDEQLSVITADFENKFDKLEAHSRRNNLRFFSIPEAEDNNHDDCTERVLDALENTVPGKRWNQEDIVFAHRLGGKRSGQKRRPRPILVQFCRWGDKMNILTKGRERLLNRGIQVAGDLTTKQQNTVRDYRERGVRAYYKGNQLVVAGPLHYQPLNRGTFADVVRRNVPSSTRKSMTNTDRQQGQRRTALENEFTREEEDYRPYPRGYTKNTGHQQDNQAPPTWYGSPGFCSNNWSDGGEWGGGYTPFDWQYYSNWQDFHDYPHHVYQPRNSENLVPVSAVASTDEATPRTANNSCHPHGSAPGQSTPPSDSQLSTSQSTHDVAAHVVTAVVTAGEGVTADTRAINTEESPDTSAASDSTVDPSANSHGAVPTQHSSTEGEPHSHGQPPGDSSTLPGEEPAEHHHVHADVDSLPETSEPSHPDEQSEEGAAGVPDVTDMTVGLDDVIQGPAEVSMPVKTGTSSSCRKHSTSATAQSAKGNPGPTASAASDCTKGARSTDSHRRLRSTSVATTACEKKQLTLSESLSNKSTKNVNKQNSNNK